MPSRIFLFFTRAIFQYEQAFLFCTERYFKLPIGKILIFWRRILNSCSAMFSFFPRNNILICRSAVFLFFRVAIFQSTDRQSSNFLARNFKLPLGSVLIFFEEQYFKVPIGGSVLIIARSDISKYRSEGVALYFKN